MLELEKVLDEVARDASKRMGSIEAMQFVDEVRDHLDASIQARMELGATPEQATREALIAFGDTKKVVKDVAGSGSTRKVVLAVYLMGVWALFHVLVGILWFDVPAYFYSFFVPPVLAMIAGYRAGRWPILRLLKPIGSTATLIPLVLVFGWIQSDSSPVGLMPRWEVNSFLAESKARIPELERKARIAALAKLAFRREAPDLFALKALETPQGYYVIANDWELSVTHVHGYLEAKAGWADVSHRATDIQARLSDARNAPAWIAEANDQAIRSAPTRMWNGIQFGAGATFFAALMALLGVILRRSYDYIARRRRDQRRWLSLE